MIDCETAVDRFLRHSGFTDLVFEPDGNIPPDFVVEGRIAVEVRRLNQNSVSVNLIRMPTS